MAVVAIKFLMLGLLLMSSLTGTIAVNSHGECEWQFDKYGISIVAPLVIGWYSGWAFETRTYIVSDIVGQWYWMGDGQSNKLRAIKRGQ